MAKAVRAQLELGLPGVAVLRVHVWLLQAPAVPPGLCPRAWALVALAALAAMEHGRRHLYALRVGPTWPDPGPAGHRVLHGALPPFLFDGHVRQHIMAERDAIVARVSNAAAGRFWHLLQDFASAQGVAPRGWAVGPEHPFLRVAPGDGRLQLRLPEGVEAPL